MRLSIQPQQKLVQQRALERARLIAQTPPVELANLEELLTTAIVMGEVLVKFRQLIEPSLVIGETTREPKVVNKIWLWEQGLLLPSEVENGELYSLIVWYLQKVRTSSHNKLLMGLSLVAIAISRLCSEGDELKDDFSEPLSKKIKEITGINIS